MIARATFNSAKVPQPYPQISVATTGEHSKLSKQCMNNSIAYMEAFMVRRLVTLVVREEASSLSLCLLTSCFLSATSREL